MIPLPLDAAGLEGTTRLLYHPPQPVVSPDAPGSGRGFRANTGRDPGSMARSRYAFNKTADGNKTVNCNKTVNGKRTIDEH